MMAAPNPNSLADLLKNASANAAAQSPAQALMSAKPVDPHDTLTAPITGPVQMAASAPPNLGAPPMPNVSAAPRMSMLAPQEDHLTQRLMADYKKDADPYGSPDNHPGFFGKLLHGLNVATGGVNRRGWEEQGLEGRIQNLSKLDSTEGLQGAEAGKDVADTDLVGEQTREMPGKASSEEGLQGAQKRHLDDESESLEHPAPPDLQHFATDDGFYSFNPKTGVITPLTYQGKPVTPTKKLTYQTVDGPDGKPHVYALDDKGNKVADEGQHYEKPVLGGGENAGTWSLQNDTNGNPILFNSKTGMTKPAPANLARKPNAEEVKRADLAENVNENLNKLDDIASRRPELFGPVAGRMTKLRETIGTDDPDVAALKTIEDNLGMALQSAHGMRSAQHVETSAQSVLNGLKNTPQALKAAIAAARQSVSTFQHDTSNTNEAGRSTPPRPANVPEGYIFKDGPKGKGWYRPQ